MWICRLINYSACDGFIRQLLGFPSRAVSRSFLFMRVCDLVIFFSCSTSPRRLSLLAEGQKWAGKEKGMAQKAPQSPSSFKWGCLWVCTPQLFSCSENRGMLNCLFVFLLFFFLENKKSHRDLILVS